MSPTRDSSPGSESNPVSPCQLTPRSKVKAMLASLDDDTDDDTDPGFSRVILESSIGKATTSKPYSPDRIGPKLRDFADTAKEDALLEKPEKDNDGDEDDQDDDIIPRPKGKLAARMQAKENARERVRKMLMAESKLSEAVTSAEIPEASDDNDMPVIRRRRNRSTKPDSPASSRRLSTASPGLFVSPTKRRPTSPPSDTSDSDELPANPAQNDRFRALVEKKRQERLAKEAEMDRKKAEKAAERANFHATQAELLHDELDVSDDNIERRLTQQARPTRKASKKAIEEMHRETQRMSRNKQLAHEARTKKKITTASFLARFNYKPARFSGEAGASRPTSSSSVPNSDMETKDTPPTSPASHGSDLGEPVQAYNVSVTSDEPKNAQDEDLPTLEDALHRLPPSSSASKLDKVKGRAIEEVPSLSDLLHKSPLFAQRPIRIRPTKISQRKISAVDESDSDLEIVSARKPSPKTKLDSIFDRVPAKQAKESHSLHTLRMLAHLTSPGKQNQNQGKNNKLSMTTTELQVSLQQRARQQAAREREERLQSLRDRGVIIQTAEEREKEMAEVDDLIAKARQEGEEIMQREKAAAKKARKAIGEVDILGDSSDDEDWEENGDIAGGLSVSDSDEDELQGTEEEDSDEDQSGDKDEMDLRGVESADLVAPNHLFDNGADETEEDGAGDEEADLSIAGDVAEERAVDEEEEEVEEEEEKFLKSKPRRGRKIHLISDDEDEDDNMDSSHSPIVPSTGSPKRLHKVSPAPNSVLRSATKTFIPGLTVAGPAGLGLTQIFAGTMDDSRLEPFDASPTASNSESQQLDAELDSLAFLRQLPVPELPTFDPTMDIESQDVILDSQSRLSHIPESQSIETQGIQLNFTQSQIHGFDSLVQDSLASQFSQFPEATQDAGFQHMTPVRGRFVEDPPSTVDTVLIQSEQLPRPTQETPIMKRKGKLRRRRQVATFSDEEDAMEEQGDINLQEEFNISANAFNVMRKASKIRDVVVEFDKKKSKAKDMVNEQAEESEDEYAGLGGGSEDESNDEEDAFVKEMIDDAAGKDADEGKLAAFYADRERANDEKQIEKLYKDITSGMLRRKRGADYDLSDSDDGGEARQRMRRREFAKMRKALLADERIGKIAENPKRQAFLRAIEDRGSEDEMNFLDDFAEHDEGNVSESQSQAEGSQPRIPDSQPTITMGPPKRKLSDNNTNTENRPPPQLRWTNLSKKPTNLSEIRESLSSLIEEPNAMIGPPNSGSDSEDELEIEGAPEGNLRTDKDKENRDPYAFRRTNVPIIDRISLKRASSSSVSTITRLAFAATPSTSGFKVPPLLRRATTNSSVASASSSSSSVSGGIMSATERMAGGVGSEGGIKRGGARSSGVNYFTRETERLAAVVKTEKRREQKRFKGAEVRRKVVGGLFGGGKFE